MVPPSLRLRQVCEALGLTYRDAQSASLAIAFLRGQPDFILPISRLADIENRDVIPSIHKLYSLAAIYHLDPLQISGWYEAPLPQTVLDDARFPPPRTHLSDCVPHAVLPHSLEPSFDRERTRLLQGLSLNIEQFPNLELDATHRFRYGYIGLSDRRMSPILRPGSMVLVDTFLRRVDAAEWTTEYDRPL